jgi:alpha/beta superfamily hydrolase
VGYSLGAILAGMMATESVAGVVAIAPPTPRVMLDIYAGCAVPKAFITGDDDFAYDQASFLRQYENFPNPKTHIRLPGCDHFFRGQEERAFNAAYNFIRKTL